MENSQDLLRVGQVRPVDSFGQVRNIDPSGSKLQPYLQWHLTRPVWLLLWEVDKLQGRLLSLFGWDDEGGVGDIVATVAQGGGGGEDEAAARRVGVPNRRAELAGAFERVDGPPADPGRRVEGVEDEMRLLVCYSVML